MSGRVFWTPPGTSEIVQVHCGHWLVVTLICQIFQSQLLTLGDLTYLLCFDSFAGHPRFACHPVSKTTSIEVQPESYFRKKTCLLNISQTHAPESSPDLHWNNMTLPGPMWYIETLWIEQLQLSTTWTCDGPCDWRWSWHVHNCTDTTTIRLHHMTTPYFPNDGMLQNVWFFHTLALSGATTWGKPARRACILSGPEGIGKTVAVPWTWEQMQ